MRSDSTTLTAVGQPVLYTYMANGERWLSELVATIMIKANFMKVVADHSALMILKGQNGSFVLI